MPHTKIISDEWCAYKRIEENLGFEHDTVNHSQNFVNPITGANTQAVESYWNKHKAYFKSIRGVQRHCLDSYLQEAMFRERRPGMVFEGLLEVIALRHPF